MRIQDGKNGVNHIDISYVEDADAPGTLRIAKVTDGAGREYAMSYASKRLSKVTYKGKNGNAASGKQRAVSYGYETRTVGEKTAYLLSSVTYPDGEQATYLYNPSRRMMSRAKDVDGYCVDFAYLPGLAKASYVPPRLKSVVQKKGSETYGSGEFTYGKLHTKVTDDQGRYNVYHFNAYGNTIFIQDREGRAQYYKYAQDSVGSERANELRMSSKLQATVVNMTKNPGFEGEGSWAEINGGSGRSWQQVTTEAHHGARSVKVRKTDAEAMMYGLRQDYAVAKGRRYTASAYVKTSGMTGNGGAVLALYCYGESGAYVRSYSERIDTEGEWRRIQVSATVPTDSSAATARLYLYVENKGTAYFDDVQMEQSEVANRYNLVRNGDFAYGATEEGTQSAAQSWKKSVSTGGDSEVGAKSGARGKLDSQVLKIGGRSAEKKLVYQTVPVQGSKGVFSVGGWGLGKCPPDSNQGYEGSPDKRRFGLEVRINYTDETTKEYFFPFNTDTDQWQYVSGRVVASRAYSSIRVGLVYDHMLNSAYFDGIQLYEEEFGASYSYDGEGNVVSARDLKGETTRFEYNGNDDLVKSVLSDGANYTGCAGEARNTRT